MMSKMPDVERIVQLLNDAPAGLSSSRIRAALRLGRDRYDAARDELLKAGQVEKYVCRGGGLRLTERGENAALAGRSEPGRSPRREVELYPIVVEQLEAEHDDEEVLSMHFAPGALRRRGRWQNPDVATIVIDVYPRLQKIEVLLLTYEVKAANAWDVSVVFEAASQQRTCFASTIILEWNDGAADLYDERLTEVVRECQRFGIGLATLERNEKAHHLNLLLDPSSHVPLLADVDGWLEYAFDRMPEEGRKFDALMQKAKRRLAVTSPAR